MHSNGPQAKLSRLLTDGPSLNYVIMEVEGVSDPTPLLFLLRVTASNPGAPLVGGITAPVTLKRDGIECMP